MHLPEIDRYAHLHSPLHSWEPRSKLVSFFFLVISISLLPNLTLSFIGIILAISLLFISKIPLGFVIPYLRWVVLFATFFLIIMSITVPGNEIIRLGFIGITKEGIRHGLLIGIKAISCVLLIFPMIGSSRFDQIIKTLQQLRLPNKSIQLLLFSYRYIFVFLEEIRRMLQASHSRLFRKKTDIYTLKVLSSLLGMLLVRSFERTQCIYNAMLSRGYSGKVETLSESKFLFQDLLKAWIIVSIAFGLHLLRLIL